MVRRVAWSGRPRRSARLVGALGASLVLLGTLVAAPRSVDAATAHDNPFVSPAISAYLGSRGDDVTAGLYDVVTGATYLYRPGVREVTASMEKIDILADLLFLDHRDHHAMPPGDGALATSMIEESDNDAAWDLWDQLGVASIERFNERIGLDQSITSTDWGQFDTTPHDELDVLRTVVLPNATLTAAARDYETSLMEHVTSWERFGVPTGVPTPAVVGVKNGWYPEAATGWQVNTAGFVHLGGTYYLAVVMTARNPNEEYGLATVDGVGRLLWQFESDHARTAAT